MNNNIYCKVRDKIIHSQTSTVQPLKFGNEWIMLFYILLYMWLLIPAAININPCG